MTFKIGMKVVCVDAGDAALGIKVPLALNAVYTVADMAPAEYGDGSTIKLVEVAPADLLSGWFYARRFRPAVSPKQQVSFTTGAPLDSEQWDNRKRVEVVS